MVGVKSGRTRQVAAGITSMLAPYRRRGIHLVADVEDRAIAYLGGAE
jgi:hypothetical protein